MFAKITYGVLGVIAAILIFIGQTACNIAPTLWNILKAVTELVVHLIVVAITAAYEVMNALIS